MSYRLAIAIESSGGKLEKVARHLGSCSKFIVCEINSNKEIMIKETYFNPLSGRKVLQSQLPGYIKQFDVNTIIAGRMGQKAIANFNQYGIDVITAPGLDFNKALNLFLQNKFNIYEKYTHR